jgi:hypothetical protein
MTLWRACILTAFIDSVRYHSGGSMKLNAYNLLLAHIVSYIHTISWYI